MKEKQNYPGGLKPLDFKLSECEAARQNRALDARALELTEELMNVKKERDAATNRMTALRMELIRIREKVDSNLEQYDRMNRWFKENYKGKQ